MVALGPAQTLSPSLPSALLEMGEKVPMGVGSLGISEHQVLRALSGRAVLMQPLVPLGGSGGVGSPETWAP